MHWISTSCEVKYGISFKKKKSINNHFKQPCAAHTYKKKVPLGCKEVHDLKMNNKEIREDMEELKTDNEKLTGEVHNLNVNNDKLKSENTSLEFPGYR